MTSLVDNCIAQWSTVLKDSQVLVASGQGDARAQSLIPLSVQEMRRQFEVLLQLGAEAPGSPASEQLAQQVRQYLQVRPTSL